MKKLIQILIAGFFFSGFAFACPDLEGVYPHCQTKDGDKIPEYVVKQFNDNGSEVYVVSHIDKKGTPREDEFRADGKVTREKKEFPSIGGINVTIEGSAACEDDSVIVRGHGVVLGNNVGHYQSKIFKTNNILNVELSAKYLTRTYNELIQCKQ